jgi:hypothetical protein
MSTTDIEKAKELFRQAGLAFPTIPAQLATRLKERDNWLFSTREVDESPYELRSYIGDAHATDVADYAILAHSGHGSNSYAIQYYLVYGALRMFLHLGWGGVYMDPNRAAATIHECFSLADEIIAAVQTSGRLRLGDRLIIVGSDFYGSYWSAPGQARREEDLPRETPATVLSEALHWLKGSCEFPPGADALSSETAGKSGYQKEGKTTPRFWVISPYNSERPDVWDKVWDFDLQHGTISISWGKLGDDISSLSDDQLRELVDRTYPEKSTENREYICRTFHYFYHGVRRGDQVIARRGMKKLAAIGTVKRSAYYEPSKNLEATPSFRHHLDVEWADAPRDISFGTRVFGMQTVYEIPEDEFRRFAQADSSNMDEYNENDEHRNQ